MAATSEAPFITKLTSKKKSIANSPGLMSLSRREIITIAAKHKLPAIHSNRLAIALPNFMAIALEQSATGFEKVIQHCWYNSPSAGPHDRALSLRNYNRVGMP